MILILLLATMVQWAQAGEIAEPGSAPAYPAASTGSRTIAQKELECIQTRLRQKNIETTYTSPQASQMIRRLSPYLEAGFKKFHVGPYERALFYSQMLTESSGLTKLNETKNFKRGAIDPVAQLIEESYDDSRFHVKKGAKHSSHFGEYRGRGLLQITGCDNFISVVHYLNLMNSGKTPVWKAKWTIPENKGKKQLTSICSKADLEAFKKKYAADYHMNADLYGAIDDPMRFAMSDGELTDLQTGKMIDSNQFMVESSLAYWRGRCQTAVEKSSDLEKLTAKGYQDRCELDGPDPTHYLEDVMQNITICVKGKPDTWRKRIPFFKEALCCAQAPGR